MRVFKHKVDGKCYRLVKQRDSNINTYVEVDKDNNIIIKKREWSIRPSEQKAVINGFDKLIDII